ncbi:MAG: prolyl-tRNA synthetase associated domain-containing protein [Mogibacterium sp.]|nr:prolyl-tRNA synthetase associated domain-containing protein [Mogibacterium sp.]MBR3331301.1 prolyl-tRNA synthetase associated domain-containing protein [Mogibacterium sp.]
MELFNGRPLDVSDRSEKEVRVYDFLDDLGISYMRLDHAPAFGSEEELCREIEDSLGARICKNLFLANRQRTRFYMLMIPEHKVFRSSDISKQAGSSRLHFAESEYMEDLIGCSPGSASVMGLINDSDHKVQLLVDDDVINSEYVGCHPCINTSSLRIRSEDIFDKFVKETGHDFIIVHAE